MGRGHNILLTTGPWLMGVIIPAFITVIAGIIWLVHRRTVASDGLTPMERKDLNYLEREILSMLRQYGGPIMQSEIVDALPGDLEDLAEVMKGMEAKGLIQREWRSNQGTYIVTA